RAGADPAGVFQHLQQARAEGGVVRPRRAAPPANRAPWGGPDPASPARPDPPPRRGSAERGRGPAVHRPGRAVGAEPQDGGGGGAPGGRGPAAWGTPRPPRREGRGGGPRVPRGPPPARRELVDPPGFGAAGAGALAARPGHPAHARRDGEPPLAAPLRPRD